MGHDNNYTGMNADIVTIELGWHNNSSGRSPQVVTIGL